ncbi:MULTISPECIES: DNA starvation/stationary phase protection protein [unclassified Rhizobium]|uniref:Dps family protein n=1 Tax=unclassified Rhizobium TaxID=2613769 RepID=UPI001FD8DB02|nr:MULTISPECIES: DNA starvation/stationary phase protection protein [unclassified Rhizobium]
MLQGKSCNDALQLTPLDPRIVGGTAVEEVWSEPKRIVASGKKSSRLKAVETRDIAAALTALIADFFALYLKTKNFRWHVSGSHFRDYHLLLDEQSAEILAAVEPMAARVRKLGATTLRSVGHVARLQRLLDNDQHYLEPRQMITELLDDNRQIVDLLREAYELCNDNGDFVSLNLISDCTDDAEGRAWVLLSIMQDENGE